MLPCCRPSDVHWGINQRVVKMAGVKGQLSTINALFSSVWTSVCSQHHFKPRQARRRLTSWCHLLFTFQRDLTLQWKHRLSKMECLAWLVLCALICFFRLGNSEKLSRHSRYHKSATESSLGNLNSYHPSRYPLYMMQLYRSFKAADSSQSTAVNTVSAVDASHLLRHSDSVISLIAKGGYWF
jgi:hypothetical protein